MWSQIAAMPSVPALTTMTVVMLLSDDSSKYSPIANNWDFILHVLEVSDQCQFVSISILLYA